MSPMSQRSSGTGSPYDRVQSGVMPASACLIASATLVLLIIVFIVRGR